MSNLVGKVLGGVAKTPGAVVGFASATALGATGGIIKATGQGIIDGVKSANKLKRKIIGEAAEAAIKGEDNVVNEVNKNINELTKQQASNIWSFKDENGRHYYRQVQTRAKVDANGNIVKDANNNVIREKVGTKYYMDSAIGRQTIDGVEYGNARKKWLGSLPDENDIMDIAQETAESGIGDGAGFDIFQFASDHPVGTALAGLGVGVVGANLLDDD